MRPLRTSAERCRWIRQGWSGNSPWRSQARQKSSVESSRSSASGALRGPPRSPSPQVTAQKPLSSSRSFRLPRAVSPSISSSMSLVSRSSVPSAAVATASPSSPPAPVRLLEAVAEARQALHLHLDLAVDAGHRPQQRAIGLVVGRGPGALAVGGRPLGDRQRVVDDDPAGVGDPGGLDHQRARLVAAADRDDDAAWFQLEVAGVAIEQRREGAGGVEARQAEPLDRAVEGDEGGGVAVGEEAVAADRGEAVFRGAHGDAKLAAEAAGQRAKWRR